MKIRIIALVVAAVLGGSGAPLGASQERVQTITPTITAAPSRIPVFFGIGSGAGGPVVADSLDETRDLTLSEDLQNALSRPTRPQRAWAARSTRTSAGRPRPVRHG